jgi:hypothetical protein
MPPVFTRDPDGAWSPSLYARGPFEGLQGGGVAALMAQAVVDAAAGGFVASITTHFLRPAPLAPLRVSVRALRSGRRVSVIDAELSSAQGLIAVQRATVIAELPDADLPTPPGAPACPERLPRERRTALHGGPWMMDTLDARVTDGRAWFRDELPLFDRPSPLGRVLVAADWAHGLFAPLGADVRPPAAIPNTDLSVNLLRLPRGEWIGVEAQTAWSPTGVGAGWAALRDAEGLIGRVAMSVAVTPLAQEIA